jgi:hypothetical protein
MRALADRERITRVMEAMARAAEGETHVYLVGGTTAVLLGWRESTIDIDFVMQPEDDAVMRALAEIKERLQVNLEMASPLDFIPVPPGWQDRSPQVRRIGRVTFHHFDPYAQALAKIERGHSQDVTDVHQMLAFGLIEPDRARRYFAQIEPELYRFPAIDAPSFRRAVDALLPLDS